MNFRPKKWKTIVSVLASVGLSWVVNMAMFADTCKPMMGSQCPTWVTYLLWFLVPAIIIYIIWSLAEKEE